jgi:hypothetical protein
VTQDHPFALHHETRVTVHASLAAAFAYLDDFEKLSAHMERPSAMMLGSQMNIAIDESGGRAVGSRIRMAGKVLGIPLSLEEVVVERRPPNRKVWETIDARLIVIGQYRLGFELEPRSEGCSLRVFIDYDLPRKTVHRWTAALLAKTYARWCTEQMAKDATTYFAAGDTRARG